MKKKILQLLSRFQIYIVIQRPDAGDLERERYMTELRKNVKWVVDMLEDAQKKSIVLDQHYMKCLLAFLRPILSTNQSCQNCTKSACSADKTSPLGCTHWFGKEKEIK